MTGPSMTAMMVATSLLSNPPSSQLFHDCRSARDQDHTLEKHGKATIWFELLDR